MPVRLPHLFSDKSTRSHILFWLGLSLLVSLYYSIPALKEAFSSEYIIQDDARQHVFWMRRFLDPTLFPIDITADYFQSVAPWGYSSLYRVFAWVGIDPVALSKVLPSILGLIVTGYCFGVGMQLLPLPIAGFATATLLNQNLWMRDDLSSATPGAFFYPIFLAFLYYLLHQSLIPCLITIALQGLFYPQGVFISAGILILRLLNWNGGIRFSIHRSRIRFCLVGLSVAFLVMLLYAFKSSEFGSVIGLAEAKTLPAFAPTGWSAFFADNFVDFWLCGKRSGLIPTEWCDLAKDNQEVRHWWLTVLRFPSIWLGLLFPIVLIAKRHFPLARQVKNWSLLFQNLLVSLAMFFIAHVLAFKLHLPNRYTEHNFRILLALAAGITLVILGDKFYRWCLRRSDSSVTQWIGIGLLTMAIAFLVSYPFNLKINDESFPVSSYIDGEHPALYRLFAKQPKDIVIASLAEEVNQIPTFAQRTVLVGGEGYVLPYHPKYFHQVDQKLTDLVQAQYSPDLQQVKNFIQQYKVDFWLLDQESLQPNFNDPKSYLTGLFQQVPVQMQSVKAQQQAGVVPALAQAVDACSIYHRQKLYVLRAKCILRQ